MRIKDPLSTRLAAVDEAGVGALLLSQVDFSSSVRWALRPEQVLVLTTAVSSNCSIAQLGHDAW